MTVADCINVLRRVGDGRWENWLWVDGVKRAYICDTHDEYSHFCARAFEMGDVPRLEMFRKGKVA